MTMTPIDPEKAEADRKNDEANYRRIGVELGIIPDVPKIHFLAAGEVLEPSEYAVPGKIPARQLTTFSGPGGVGKSLVTLQLLASSTLGRDWFGARPKKGPTIYVGAEDELSIIRDRLDAIGENFDEPSSADAMIGAGLSATSYAGEDMTLAHFARKTGTIEPTPLFNLLMEQACDINPTIIVLDTLSDIFGGNENERSQVASFVALLRKMAMAANCAVITCLHPSQAGIKSGSGESGSSAWAGKARGRMFMRPSPDDLDVALLSFLKNQYGAKADDIKLRFQNGIFVPEVVGVAGADPVADEVFLAILARLTSAGRHASDKPSRTFAPVLFTKEPEAVAKKLKKTALADAMIRLFAAGKIRVETDGPPSKLRTKIVLT